MSDLPKLSVHEAIRLKVRHFMATRACKHCGGYERYMVEFSPHFASCLGCEGAGGFSFGRVKAQEGKHNRHVEKAKRDNWKIPVVFSGLNSSPR